MCMSLYQLAAQTCSCCAASRTSCRPDAAHSPGSCCGAGTPSPVHPACRFYPDSGCAPAGSPAPGAPPSSRCAPSHPAICKTWGNNKQLSTKHSFSSNPVTMAAPHGCMRAAAPRRPIAPPRRQRPQPEALGRRWRQLESSRGVRLPAIPPLLPIVAVGAAVISETTGG